MPGSITYTALAGAILGALAGWWGWNSEGFETINLFGTVLMSTVAGAILGGILGAVAKGLRRLGRTGRSTSERQ